TRTHRESLLLHSEPSAIARRPAPPATNVRRVQRSCRVGPLVPASAPPPRRLPAPSLFPRLVPRSRVSHMHRPPAQAAPCGPVSRWPSTPASPAAHTPPAPCTPAPSPLDAGATVRLLSLPFLTLRLCSRPPGADPRPNLRGQSPPLPVLPRAPPGSPRPLPARSGILGSSVENRCAPGIQLFRPPAISPGRRSCTSDLPHYQRKGCSRSAPPSDPLDSDILAPARLPRYITLQPRRLAPAPHVYPGCRCWCLRWAFQQ